MERDALTVERDARAIEPRTWFRRVAQVGLLARAVIYLVLAGLALELATRGRSFAQADTDGAFVAIARQRGGPFLLVVLASGCVAYAVWRLVQAIAGGAVDDRVARWTRLGRAASGALYLLLSAEALELRAGTATGSISSRPEPLVARVLVWPVGPEVIGLVAIAIATSGVALGVWGFLHDYRKVIDAPRLGRYFGLARASGAAGDGTRGLLLVIGASYLFFAAVTDNPTRSMGLGHALQALVHEPLGPELLGVLGAGLAAFSGYSVIEALYRRSAV
ncbi:MAG: DUF1206 domain-containing protein [Acidimicrobiales bacterium]